MKRLLILSIMVCFIASGLMAQQNNKFSYTGKAVNSTAYTLTITETSRRTGSSPAGGDSYELSFSDRKSTGTVTTINAGLLTLKPSNSAMAFTVWIDENLIVSITGTITSSDGGTQPGPGDMPAGEGTAGNPFRIRNVTELGYLAKGTPNPDGYKGWTLSAHYRQIQDIDMSGKTWTPVGSSSSNSRFAGVYDGGGFKIKGITINPSSNSYQGLFGCTGTSAIVKNIGLVDCNINGNEYVGGIVGHNYGTVQDCYITGTVTGTNENTGGITGRNDGTVRDCYSTCSVTGAGTNGRTGGVVGNNNNGTVKNCHSTGPVNGRSAVGGVVGYNNSTVEDCYATGNVTSALSRSGGVIGYNYTNGKVQRCYATGDIRSTTVSGDNASQIAGVAAVNYGTVEYCWASGNVYGFRHLGGVIGLNNGGTVQYCYATGNVNGTGGENGSVVGMNSERGTVKYCYGTGDVTGSSYIGGVVGSNTGNGNSILQYCYATGSVQGSGDRIGGVVGNLSTTIQNCVGLNKSVSTGYGSSTTIIGIGRVVGYAFGSSWTKNNNYGRDSMPISHNGKDRNTFDDGTAVTSTLATTASWWTNARNWDTAAWSTAIWDIQNGKLPTLKGMPTAQASAGDSQRERLIDPHREFSVTPQVTPQITPRPR